MARSRVYRHDVRCPDRGSPRVGRPVPKFISEDDVKLLPP